MTLIGAFAPWTDASSGAQEGSAILAVVFILIGPFAWLTARLLIRAADARLERDR